VRIKMFVEYKDAQEDIIHLRHHQFMTRNQFKVRGSKQIVNIVAVIDDGSNITLLHSNVAEKIGATGQRVPVCCSWSAGISRYDDRSESI
jgi:hypothetical protein